jgi:hypothetical protein
MLKSISAFALTMLTCAPALADGMEYAPRRYYPQRFYLQAERPPACFGWAAGERITLIAGDWNGRCAVAAFYNFYRRNTCEMWCGGGWWW